MAAASRRPLIAQQKNGAAPHGAGRPVPPPAYQPQQRQQATLQAKAAPPANSSANAPQRVVPPPVYRPQTMAPAAQAKIANAANSRKSAPAPAYRQRQALPILQRKSAQAGVRPPDGHMIQRAAANKSVDSSQSTHLTATVF